MTLQHAKEAALTTALLAVVLLLFAQVDYYVRHLPG
jgi:hypothetical protein